VKKNLGCARGGHVAPSTPPAFDAGRGVDSSMAEVQTLAVEMSAEDQGDKSPYGHEVPAPSYPISAVHVIQEPRGRQGTPPRL
jgi:hypothetical protein